MKKIRIGIVGYGNLGKAVERLCENDDRFTLVAIFSHRAVCSPFNNVIYNIDKLYLYNNIDILIMCGGSYKDIPKETQKILSKFDVINSYDTHSKILNEIKKANKIAKKSGTVALYSFGWDPGLFSLLRALTDGVSTNSVHTVWGNGVSMGHSNALKEIEGVVKAKSYTIPKNKSVAKMRNNLSNKFEIIRKCVIVKKDSKSKSEIINKIRENKTYFGDCKLKVKFVSEKNFENKYNKNFHQGEVFSNFNIDEEKFSISYKVKMTSNALFTARILLMYAAAIKKIKKKMGAGAFTILEIPLCDVINLPKNLQISKFV